MELASDFSWLLTLFWISMIFFADQIFNFEYQLGLIHQVFKKIIIITSSMLLASNKLYLNHDKGKSLLHVTFNAVQFYVSYINL
jgi:hypothetical protein